MRHLGEKIGCAELWLFEARNFTGADEDSGEHRCVEPAGVRVAQGRMIAAEQSQAVGQ
jgi:hypothetical protein